MQSKGSAKWPDRPNLLFGLDKKMMGLAIILGALSIPESKIGALIVFILVVVAGLKMAKSDDQFILIAGRFIGQASIYDPMKWKK